MNTTKKRRLNILRLRLYIDGVSTTYAKESIDGTVETDADEKFYSNTVLAQGRKDNFSSGSVTKFTIVVWIEGEDKQCNDNIDGGSMRLEMFIEIAH